MVDEVGLEPTRDCSHRILSPVCLPIPPLVHMVGGEGFEPSNSMRTELQSAAFDQLGNPPIKNPWYSIQLTIWHYAPRWQLRT